MTSNARAQHILNILGVSEGQEKEYSPENSTAQFTDGDSGTYINSNGIRTGFRATGYDAPETTHAPTRTHGLQVAEPMAYMARDELNRQIQVSGGADIIPTGEKDTAKGGGTYGRDLARIHGRDGRDINNEMIRTGLVDQPMYTPGKEDQLAFIGANLRNNTDFGDTLVGDDRTLNENVRAAQNEAFRKRETGELPPIFGNSPTPYTRVSTARAAYGRGVHNLTSSLAGFSAAIGDAVGNEELKSWSEEKMEAAIRRAGEFPAEVQHWDDVDSLDKFGTFALEKVMENAPQLGVDAAMLIGTGGTSLAVRVGFAKALSRELGVDALKFAGRDASVALNANLYGQLTGETAGQLNAAGVEDYGVTALIAGAIKTPMERLALNRLVRSGAIGKIASEGVTEGAQTTVDNVAQSYHTGEDVFSPENIRDTLTAAAAGAIVGGAVATVHDGVPAAYQFARDKMFKDTGVTAPVNISNASVDRAPVGNPNPPSAPDSAPSAPASGVNTSADGHIVTQRESKQEVDAQIERFANGEKKGIYVSAENADSYDDVRAAAEINGANVIETEEGLIATHDPRITKEEYQNASPAEREAIKAHVIDAVQSKADIDPTTAVGVQTRDEHGNIITQHLVSPDAVQEQVAAHQAAARPTDTIEVTPVADAMAERTEKVNAEQRTDGSDPARAVLLDGQQLQTNNGVGSAIPHDPSMGGGVQGQDAAMAGVGQTESPEIQAARDASNASGERADVSSAALPSDRSGRVESTVPVQTDGSGADGRVPATSGDGGSDGVLGRDYIGADDGSTNAGTGGDRANEDIPPLRSSAHVANNARVVNALMGRGYTFEEAVQQLKRDLTPATEQDLGDESYTDPSFHGELSDETAPTDSEQTPIVENEYRLEDTDDITRVNNKALGEYYGQLMTLHRVAFHRQHPTWELTPIPSPNTDGKNKLFFLKAGKRQFRSEAVALREAGKLKTLYAGDIFLPEHNQSTGKYELTRHALNGGLSDEVDTTRSWLYRNLPKFQLNSREAMKGGRAQKELAVAYENRSPTEIADAQRRLHAEKSKVVFFAHSTDEATGTTELTAMHAPSITAAGYALITELDTASALERDFAAFTAGVASLHIAGYSIAETYDEDSHEYSKYTSNGLFDVSFAPKHTTFTRNDVIAARKATADILARYVQVEDALIAAYIEIKEYEDVQTPAVQRYKKRKAIWDSYKKKDFAEDAPARDKAAPAIPVDEDALRQEVVALNAEKKKLGELYKALTRRSAAEGGASELAEEINGTTREEIAAAEFENAPREYDEFGDSTMPDNRASGWWTPIKNHDITRKIRREAIAERRALRLHAEKNEVAKPPVYSPHVNRNEAYYAARKAAKDRILNETETPAQISARRREEGLNIGEVAHRDTHLESLEPIPLVAAGHLEVGTVLRQAYLAGKKDDKWFTAHTTPFKRITNEAQPTGVPVQQVHAAATAFLKKFPGANDVTVKVLPYQESYAKGIEKGSYDPKTNTMTLIASNFHGAADVEKTLQHEILVHKGLGFLTDEQASEFFNQVHAAIQTNREVAEIFNNLRENYDGFDDLPTQRQVEEVIAFVAEGMQLGLISRAMNSIVMAIRKVLKAMGLIGDSANLSDIQAQIYSMASAFRAGKVAAPRTTEVAMHNKKSGEAYIVRPVYQQNFIIKALSLLAQHDAAFKHRISRAEAFPDIVGELLGMKGYATHEGTTNEEDAGKFRASGAETIWTVVNPKGKNALIFQKGDEVWLDISKHEEGDGGSAVYNAVANYTYNTGKVFIGDPAGLKIATKARRLEMMISSALKFGTTRHLAPHALQLQSDWGVPAITWTTGSDAANILSMINASYKAALMQAPEIADIHFDMATGTYHAIKGPHKGTERSLARIALDIRASARDFIEPGTGNRVPYSIGRRTLERAVLVQSFGRATDAGKQKLLAQLRGGLPQSLHRTFYSRGNSRNTGAVHAGGAARVSVQAIAAARGITPAKITETTKNVVNGFKKLALPMFNGLYQLNEISRTAASLFKRYWAARDRARAQWGREFDRLNLTSAQIGAAWKELNAIGESNDPADFANISEEAAKLRTFLDRFHTLFAKPSMPLIGHIKNFLPQLIDIRVMQERKDEFIAIVSEHKLIGSDKHLGVAGAEEVYNSLAATGKGNLLDLEDMQNVVGPRNSHMKRRALRSPELMGALEKAGFLFEDKEIVMQNYITTAINRGAFEAVMSGMRPISGFIKKGKRNYGIVEILLTQAGRDDLLEQYAGKNLLQAAIDQGYAEVTPAVYAPKFIPEKLSWYAPTQRLANAREGVAEGAERRRMDEIVHGFMGYFGSRVSPSVHKWQSNILAYESTLVLAFNTLSSLPDMVGGILTIMRNDGVVEALKGLRASMRSINNYGSLKAQATELGLLNKRQTQALLKEMWGTDHQSAHAEKVLDTMFKWNLQEGFTNMSRVFTMGVGQNYFTAKAAANDDAALSVYGLSAERVTRWKAAGSPAFTAEIMEKGGIEAADARAMHGALHRFIDESIIRPNSGQKPVWANDPRFALFWHLKSFLWAYFSVVIAPTGKSIINQIQKGNHGEAAAQSALMGLLLFPLAALGWEIRQLIQYSPFDEEQPSDEMDGFAYAMQLINRTGVAGPIQLAFDATGQESMDEGLVRISGPTLGHAWTLLNGDWDEKLYRSVPLVSQLYGGQKLLSDNFKN